MIGPGSFIVLAAALALSPVGGSGAAVDPSGGGSVPTGFAILVGFPTALPATESGTLLVPGTVIPFEVSPGSPDARRELVERRMAFNAAVDRLWSTFRLDPARRLEKGAYLEARVGSPLDLPSLAGTDVSVSATLLGFNDTLATFRVVFRQGTKSLADSTVSVTRGGRAVVGGMDGDAAPYLFVVVEPDLPGSPSAVRRAEVEGVSEPRLVKTVAPKYPEGARQAGISGVVVLDVVVAVDGTVVDVRVLDSPGPFLAEAAVEAVRQWQFEPARSASGAPVKVLSAVTVKFALQ